MLDQSADSARLGEQDERGALADIVRSSLAKARQDAQSDEARTGGANTAAASTAGDEALDAMLQRHAEKRRLEQVPCRPPHAFPCKMFCSPDKGCIYNIALSSNLNHPKEVQKAMWPGIGQPAF